MKLKDTTYNEKYPSFDIRAMNPKMEGVPLGESLSIKLVPDVFMWDNPKTGEKVALSGPLLVKEIPKKAGGSFTVNELTGKVVSDNVDNIKYSERDQATFNINASVANKILEAYSCDELGGKTLKLTLVEETKDLPVKKEDGTIEVDENGKWVMKETTYMTFKSSIVNDDGSETPIGGKGSNSSSSSSTPSEATKEPPLELTAVETSVFKEVRVNQPDWKAYGLQNLDNFIEMYNTIATALSVEPVDLGRAPVLFARFMDVK